MHNRGHRHAPFNALRAHINARVPAHVQMLVLLGLAMLAMFFVILWLAHQAALAVSAPTGPSPLAKAAGPAAMPSAAAAAAAAGGPGSAAGSGISWSTLSLPPGSRPPQIRPSSSRIDAPKLVAADDYHLAFPLARL